MNILIVTKSFPPLHNARALQIKKVADALYEAGGDVTVVAGADNPERIPIRTPYKVSYLPYRPAVPYQRIRNLFRSAWWIMRAYRAVCRFHAKRHADVLLTASVPGDAHIVGLLCRCAHRMVWCAYFSDPWPLSMMPAAYRRSRAKVLRSAEICCLQACARKADGIIAPSSYLLRWMQKYVRESIANKSISIPHIGTPAAPSGHVHNDTLVHIGDVHNRVSMPLLEACRMAHMDETCRFQKLQFIGANANAMMPAIEAAGASTCVTTHGVVTAAEAAALAATSGALLVIEAQGMHVSPFLPSKFADYVMTGRPILAISPPASEIRDYLERYGGGVAVSHRTAEIMQAIRQLFDEQHAFSRARDPQLPELFSAPSIAAQYLAFFAERKRQASFG